MSLKSKKIIEPIAEKVVIEFKPEEQKKSHWKKMLIVFGILVVIVGVVFGGAAVLGKVYQNKVYPGVYLDHFHVGGMNAEEVNNFLEGLNNRLAKEGIVLSLKKEDGTETQIKINNVLGNESAIELVEYQGEEAGRVAMAVGRTGSRWQNFFAPLYYRFFNKEINTPVLVNVGHLTESLQTGLAPYADAPHDANIKMLDIKSGQYEIVPEKSGSDFVYPKIIEAIKNNLSALSFAPISVSAEHFLPSINSSEAAAAAGLVPKVFGYGSIGLNYVDPQSKLRTDWNIAPNVFADWIIVKKDDSEQLLISLDKEKVVQYLENLRSEVDKPTKDAKFIMTDGVVKEFQTSQSGLSLDIEKTANDLIVAFEERNYHPAESVKTVGLTVNVAEPDIKMSETNDLGIETVIGVGVSSFKGSHTNRIKNIGIAVKRVNGTLVRPGEEFSSLKAAGPFTPENGFLPELVIKGNEIKNEIGGGMCQIGTTLFRMAMNSGMPITARRNHSLVVNYYADPVNGNPGTDATLYEPILDFKFLNDTGHYLLVQTAIDYKKQELTFTLWGKDDGRKGWYTHPVVSKWIPPGETQVIETDKLKPGVRECQAAYKGAVASFTYSRVTPAGEKIDRVFDSYYRPLQEICMLGVAPATTTPASTCADPNNCPAPVVEGDIVTETPLVPPSPTTTN